MFTNVFFRINFVLAFIFAIYFIVNKDEYSFIKDTPQFLCTSKKVSNKVPLWKKNKLYLKDYKRYHPISIQIDYKKEKVQTAYISIEKELEILLKIIFNENL